MTDTTAPEWTDGQLAYIEYPLRRGGDYRLATARAEFKGHRWYDRDTGFWIPAEHIEAIRPLYLVSLDAAIEAAAREFCRIHLGEVWDSITEPARDGYRDYFRSVLTAAVRGCVN